MVGFDRKAAFFSISVVKTSQVPERRQSKKRSNHKPARKWKIGRKINERPNTCLVSVHSLCFGSCSQTFCFGAVKVDPSFMLPRRKKPSRFLNIFGLVSAAIEAVMTRPFELWNASTDGGSSVKYIDIPYSLFGYKTIFCYPSLWCLCTFRQAAHEKQNNPSGMAEDGVGKYQKPHRANGQLRENIDRQFLPLHEHFTKKLPLSEIKYATKQN